MAVGAVSESMKIRPCIRAGLWGCCVVGGGKGGIREPRCANPALTADPCWPLGTHVRDAPAVSLPGELGGGYRPLSGGRGRGPVLGEPYLGISQGFHPNLAMAV